MSHGVPASRPETGINDAYSPRTGLVYTATSNQLRNAEGDRRRVRARRRTTRCARRAGPAPEGAGCRRTPANCRPTIRSPARPCGEFRGPAANMAPVMATGGDLLFQGGPNEGVFRAINARTGEIVWTFRTGSNFRNSPISYIGPDGRQYVAIIGSQAAASERVATDAAATRPAVSGGPERHSTSSRCRRLRANEVFSRRLRGLRRLGTETGLIFLPICVIRVICG